MKIENKTPIAEEIIRNNPTGHGLFAGIGDNFNSVAQVICELMDDAVSNLRANSGDPELSMRVVLSRSARVRENSRGKVCNDCTLFPNGKE